MAVQRGKPGSDAQAAHVAAVHAANSRHSDTGHIAAAHARNHYNHPEPGSVGFANINKTDVMDPTVPRDYNEPTRPYSKPKIPGKNT